MATISHIPNPVEVSVKTAGYTIPANRYARAVVNVIGSATFTINAVTALSGTQNNVLGSTPVNYGTATGSPGNHLASAALTTSLGTAFTSAIDQKNLVAEYFLPAGTIINGTGTWRAVVEEYGG